MLPILVYTLGVALFVSLAGVARAIAIANGHFRHFARASPRNRWNAHSAAVTVLISVACCALDTQHCRAGTVNADVALAGTFGSLGGSGTGSITSITGVLKTWALFGHIDTVLTANPQVRNFAVSTPGIPSSSASGLANFDFDNLTPGSPSLLRSLSVDINGAGGNNKNIGFTGGNAASPFDISIGILGTAGLIVGLNGSITNLTFASTAGSAAHPNYSIPGEFTVAWTGALTARLVDVPLIGSINLGTLGAALSGTLVIPGSVPGTLTLDDLQGGAGPFPHDMLASFTAAVAASAPITVTAPIVSDQTWTVPEGQDGFSSLRIRGNMVITLNLSLSHNLNGKVENALVPEPGSLTLLVVGAAGVTAAGLQRKRR